MKHLRIILQLILAYSFFYLSAAQAGIPVWSFTPDPNFPPHTTVNAGDTVTVRYTVTNNSFIRHTLVLKPQRGVHQVGTCVLGPRGSENSTCVLSLTIVGSELPPAGVIGGPILCQANPNGSPNPNQCYQPGFGDSLAIIVIDSTPFLTASLSDLALSITGLTLDGLPSGQARTFTITNTGNAPAIGLAITYPSFPAGTTVDTGTLTACADGITLAVGASCTITIVPGATATSGAGAALCTTGIAPIPGVVSVTANTANQTATNVVVLGYGCVYQGGLIYAMFETVDTAQSIGGQVVSQVDQAQPEIGSGPQLTSIIWSSNGSGSAALDVSRDDIPLISDILGIPSYAISSLAYNARYNNTLIFPFPPANAFTSCTGSLDGACNVSNIFAFYNTYITNFGTSFSVQAGPTPLNFYAAGKCTGAINGYSDWYLPAICRMDALNVNVACAANTQDILQSLAFLIGDPAALSPSTSCGPPAGVDCFAGLYWSSTEYASEPDAKAWSELYDVIGGSNQLDRQKANTYGVRCTRDLII